MVADHFQTNICPSHCQVADELALLRVWIRSGRLDTPTVTISTFLNLPQISRKSTDTQ